MKTLIATIALALLLTACTQPTASSGGMISADMMQNCQSNMKDGKMMDSMPKDMMAQCQQMMKNCQGMMAKNGMMQKKNAMSGDMMNQCQQMMQGDNTAPLPAISPNDTSATDHKKHHPAQ